MVGKSARTIGVRGSIPEEDGKDLSSLQLDKIILCVKSPLRRCGSGKLPDEDEDAPK